MRLRKKTTSHEANRIRKLIKGILSLLCFLVIANQSALNLVKPFLAPFSSDVVETSGNAPTETVRADPHHEISSSASPPGVSEEGQDEKKEPNQQETTNETNDTFEFVRSQQRNKMKEIMSQDLNSAWGLRRARRESMLHRQRIAIDPPFLHSFDKSNSTLSNFNASITTGEDTTEFYKNYTSQYCLTDACIQEVANDLARAFPDRTNKEIWCIPNDNRNVTEPKHMGLILVKVPKAASSTAAAAVLRLGHRHNCDLKYVHWDHQRAHLKYAFRDPGQSFMLTSIRSPATQIVSYVFWTLVTLRDAPKERVTDAFLLRRILKFGTTLGSVREYKGGLQTQFAALEDIPRGAAWDPIVVDMINPESTISRVKAIIDGYDFVLVVERMDESLVALSLILGVPVGDVVVTSSKVSAPTGKGGNVGKEDRLPYVYSFRRRTCLPMIPSFVPPVLDGYLRSDLFRSQAYGDLVLQAAANRSLDLTIERLGDRFKQAYNDYMYWKNREKDECGAEVQFPCSRDGVPQLEKAKEHCYDRDMACGHKCLDRLLAQGKT